MPLTTSTVKYEVRDRVAWITLNRPEAMNALSLEETHGIAEAALMADADNDVLAVVVIGEGGRAFCAGNDLVQQTQRDAGAVAGAQWTMRGSDYIIKIRKPVIAAIDGYALGGGMQLASSCDFRIATEKSRVGQPEARWSLLAVGTIDTPESFIPMGEAKLILMTGIHMTAQRAYDIGYIQYLVPDREALIKQVEWLVNEIKKCAPLAVRLIKRSINEQRNLPMPRQGVRPIDHLRTLTNDEREQVAKSEDRLEGPKSFAEKRPAKWKSR